MAASVDFKVFLKKNNSRNENNVEIRRFAIDADVVTNFTYLREKLQVVFPDIRGKRFTVAWKGNYNILFANIFFTLLQLVFQFH